VNSLADIDLSWVLIHLAVLLFSLSLHESAHAWVAYKLGDPTGKLLGRVTLNPIPHIDPIGTLLFPAIGLLSGFALFGWAKPVPVNTRALRNPQRDHVLVSAAGPASNLIAAVGFLIGLKFLFIFFPSQLEMSHPVLNPLALVFSAGITLNVILMVFNLIPIPPLDGSWILSGLSPVSISRFYDALRPYGFLLLVVLLWSGLVEQIIGPVLALFQALAS